MWVFCCGMRRAGSTVQYQITARLVEDAGLGKRVGWVRPERFPELREEYSAYHGWKIFKAHICTDAMVAEFAQHNATGVYVFRDLRDVFVSAMRKESASFQTLWSQGFLEQCLDGFQRWTSLPRVLVSKYEEMASNLPGEVERIAAHLGISLEVQECKEIALDYTIERQQERIEGFGRQSLGQQPETDASAFDALTLLHADHIHSGRVGAWREGLSSSQIDQIERKARNWLIANGYQLTEPRPSVLERMLLCFRGRR